MLITYNWIKKYIDVEVTSEELSSRLTMAGLETSIQQHPEGLSEEDNFFLNVDLTPNRSDCLSIKGIAREISAIFNIPMKSQTYSLKESIEKTDKFVSVEILNTKRCPNYSARLIRNVKVAPSPKWLLDLLVSVGIRPINNVVDITNYILWSEGHPIHAFDYNLIEGKKIVVRNALDGEEFITLDGKKRTLTTDDLLIASENRGIALAGIMGGENTEVKDDTKDILLECAYFEPTGIRKTARRIGLHTESSHRFGRGVDPESVARVSDWAAAMIAEIAGGEVCSGAVDSCSYKSTSSVIKLRIGRLNKILGASLQVDDIASILKRLNFLVKQEQDVLSVTVPSFRIDVAREIDLIEEVARIYGYENIQTSLPSARITPSLMPERIMFENGLRNLLSAKGCTEIINYSFIGEKEFISSMSGHNVIEIRNPISQDMSLMRQSLIPGVIKNISLNKKRGNNSLAIFEIGNIYEKRSNFIDQKALLCICLTPSVNKELWAVDKKRDFYSIKGLLDSISQSMKISKPLLKRVEDSSLFHPGKSATILIDDKIIGRVGVLNSDYLDKYEVNEELLVIELEIDALIKAKQREIKYQPLSKYPVVIRDISLTVDLEIDGDTIINLIKENHKEGILKKVTIFDVYQGKSIPEGKKSIACSLEFASDERTLLDEEINLAYENIFAYVNQKTGSTLRHV
jgi:phenylalanyl-tRNA synthetase beta chain